MAQKYNLMLLFLTVTCCTYGIISVEGLIIAVNEEQHMTVMENTPNVALNCPITGATLPVVYTWYHNPADNPLNETQITAASAPQYQIGKSALTITALSKNDQGDFRAQVKDNAGGFGTCRFNINVAYPPIFVNLPPPEIYVNLSQSFNLDCITDGNPTPTVNWLKDGIEVGNTSSQNAVFVGSQIQFKKIEPFDRGSYQCNATNEYGSVVSPSSLLYVDVPLTFSSTPLSVMNLHAGENVTLECNITGFPHPIITWFKDGIKLTNDNYRTISKVYKEIHSWSRLKFTDIKHTDSGLYTCEAQNRNQEIVFLSEVIVQVPPKITSHHPKGLLVNLGDPFSLDCKATGVPPPTYEWFHNGKPIPMVGNDHYKADRREGMLQIKKSNGDDNGDYYCQVVNAVGEANSGVTAVYIDGLHFLKRPSEEVFILRGTSKELPCEVAGSRRKITIHWYKDGIAVKAICPKGVDATSSDCPIEVLGNSLILNRVSLDEQGVYTCVGKEIDVANPKEIRAIANVHIMVEPTFYPPLPSLIEARRLSDVTINCTASGKPPPKILWQKNGIHLSNDTYRSVSDGVLHFSELHPRHNGKYTCTASNGAGRVVQVTRIHCNSGPATLTLNASIAARAFTALVSWEILQKGGSDTSHFEMEFREISPIVTTWVPIGGEIPGHIRQYQLADLKANTTYQLHMWAINKQGAGEILTKEFSTLLANFVSKPELGNNHIIMIGTTVAVVVGLILLVICIIMTRKNSNVWISKKHEDGHALMNNQDDNGSHVNPAFNSDSANNQRGMGMELNEVRSNYGSTTEGGDKGGEQLVDTST